ncbi:MAG: hypothetical protein QXM65_08210 [Candidatus Bathyarchaeia archaeon]
MPLYLQSLFGKTEIVAFDSRIVLVPDEDTVVKYMAWRQNNAWRNHNNAYAYWVLRKSGCKPSEASKKLKRLKTEGLHEIAFKHGVNLAETPAWQRRGILVYKEPYIKQTESHVVERWRLKAEWNTPLFMSGAGVKLIKQIIEWKRRKRKKVVRAAKKSANFRVKSKNLNPEGTKG